MEQVFSINEFKGLGDPYRFGTTPGETRVLSNMAPKFGRMVGRDGFSTLGTAAGGSVIGLFDYPRTDFTSFLVRFSRNDIMYYDTGSSAWTDIRGGLNIFASSNKTIAHSAVHGNALYFQSPLDILFKWTGSGNVTQNSNAPLARYMESFEGFLMLGAAAPTNGTGGTIDELMIRYEDDEIDATWDTPNVLTLNQTPGGIRMLKRFGRTLFVYKSDGIIALRFIDGAAVFGQEQVPFGLGLLAPLTCQAISEVGHIFLATDGQLYLNNGNVQAILSKVNNTLLKEMLVTQAANCVAAVNEKDSIYSLFYPTISGYLDKRLDFNYRNGEFTVHSYGVNGQWQHATYSTYSSSSTNNPTKVLVGAMESTANTTHILNTGLNDGSQAVTRYWTSDWQDFGQPGDKYLTRIDIIMAEDSRSEIEVSSRTDFRAQYVQKRRYSISAPNNDTDIVVTHKMTPELGRWHDIKIQAFPTSAGSNIQIKRIDLFFDPVGPTSHKQTPLSTKGA